jgi:ABC-type glycerol-3-phosphate transport system substrate-binding protein
MVNSKPPGAGMSRRLFNKSMAALGGAAMLPGLGSVAFGADGKLVFWDYKYPPASDGHKYFVAAAERFKAQSGIEVTVDFKSAEVIEQAVAAAANAGSGLDSMVWWSGPTVRNQASLGNVIALDDKIPADVLAAKAGMDAMRYNGKIYGVPRTIGTYFLVYNKKLLADIGVDTSVFPEPDKDPVAWDAFIKVCDQIKASGKTAPLMFANKEGYFNEWYFYNLILQGFDTSDEIAQIGAGKSTWKQEPIYKALAAYRQLYENKYFVDGGEVVAYEQHVRQMGSGQCAMSVYFDQTGGATAAIAESYGADAVGLTRVPNHRTDKKLYGHSSLEPDALYVTSFASNQEDAVRWVNFLVALPEVNEMVKALQLAPADNRFDTSLVKDPQLAKLYKGAADKGSVYPLTLVTQAQYNALLQNGILYLSGRMTAEELCASFDAADKDYLSQQ